jgi:hypothetical protein
MSLSSRFRELAAQVPNQGGSKGGGGGGDSAPPFLWEPALDESLARPILRVLEDCPDEVAELRAVLLG